LVATASLSSTGTINTRYQAVHLLKAVQYTAELIMSARSVRLSVKIFDQSVFLWTGMKDSAGIDFSVMILMICW